MNDNNNFPRNSKNNNKLPEGWGKANNGANNIFSANKDDTKVSPWENKPKTTAWENSPQTSPWENSPQTSPWGNTNNNSENRSSKFKSVNTKNVNAAINKFAGMAKRAGEKAVSTAADAAKNAADYAKSDAVAEKMNATKNKAQAFASGAGSKLSDIKNKASDKISERKNKEDSIDKQISAADEYDTTENYDVLSGETVYQNNEEIVYDADAPIASDNSSSEDDTNENSSSVPVSDFTSNKNEERGKSSSADEKISAADKHNSAENFDVPSSEAVQQSDEDYSYEVPAPIADDGPSYEHESDENVSSAHVQSFTAYKKESQGWEIAANDANIQPAPMSSPPVYNTGTYSYEKEKKSEIIPILIGIIVFLIIGVGVLFGIFFKQNKRENINNSGTNVMYEEPTEGMISTSSDTSSENETQPKTEIASQQEAIPSEEQIMQAVQKAMYAHLDAEFNQEQTVDYYYFDRDVKYALYDIDENGIDELYISYNAAACTVTDIYVYNNGKYSLIGSFGEGVHICLENHYIMQKGYGGGEMTKIHILAENELLQKDEFSQLYSTELHHYHNNHVISESEYNQLKSTYDSMNWIYVPDNSRAFSDMIDMSNYASKNKIPSEYKGYENIENAPADMEFYDVNKTVKGYVKAESTGLNMRAGAGTDYKVAHEIPRGAEVEIIGANSEWYYVKYFTGGAGAFAVDFCGYVSSQYISTTPVVIETVDVYSCKFLGRLNTHGLGVAGFATSYVVDGGEVSEVRHTLGDGWHVTAVNWCYSRDVLWYELYDSDDGDYYGWVDANYIDFY